MATRFREDSETKCPKPEKMLIKDNCRMYAVSKLLKKERKASVLMRQRRAWVGEQPCAWLGFDIQTDPHRHALYDHGPGGSSASWPFLPSVMQLRALTNYAVHGTENCVVRNGSPG
jgi:hypothetical protein